MTAFDDTFRKLAVDLIDNKFGTAATLRRKVGTYNVTTGKSTPTSTDYPVTISPPAPVSEEQVNGTIEAGDSVCYLAAQTAPIVPSVNTDCLVWNSSEWKIVEVRPLVSGDQFAAFQVVFRQ